MKRNLCVLTLTLVLTSLLVLTFNVTPVKAIIEPPYCEGVPVPVGLDVTVFPAPGIELRFENVTEAGFATATVAIPPPPPRCFKLVGSCYDIVVTARFCGKVRVAMAYDDSNMTLEEEYRLRMLQYTPLRGDVNKDGRVDWKDVRRVLRAMDSHPGSCRWDRRCDVNHDGVVNCRDLRIVLRNLGRPAWRNITIEVNTVDNLVYGETTHFSLIGIHKPA